MKTLRSQDHAKMAEELYEIISIRKKLDAREREIKKYFKELGDESYKAGGYLIIQKECMTTSLDRDAILREHGPNFLNKYIKETYYKTLAILKDRAA